MVSAAPTEDAAEGPEGPPCMHLPAGRRMRRPAGRRGAVQLIAARREPTTSQSTTFHHASM